MKYILSILALVVMQYHSLASGADSPWRSYFVKSLPISDKGCERTALELGEKFTKATGQEVYRSTCERSSKDGYDILITYFAVNPVHFVSTGDEQGAIGSLGVYATLSDCLNELKLEVDTFSKATGLIPFVSYCFKSGTLSHTPFAARIDAWGDAKMYPYRFEQSISADTLEKPANLLSSIQTAVEKLGLPAHQVRLVKEGNLQLVIRYYAVPGQVIHQLKNFKLQEMGRFASRGEKSALTACRLQLEEARTGFDKTYSTPGIWFCAWDSLIFEASLNLLRIRPVEWIKTEILPDRYPTYDECDKEKNRAKTFYEKMLGVSPFTALCSWTGGLLIGKEEAYVMKMLTKSNEPEFEIGPWP